MRYRQDLLIPFFILVFTVSALAQKVPRTMMDVIEITGERVNIRAKPTTSSRVLCQAVRGQTFEYKETVGSWYRILMFSGQYRYIHSSIARLTSASNDAAFLGNKVISYMMGELTKAEDRGYAESRGNTDFARELGDCYKLVVFTELKLPPHVYTAMAVYAARHGLL